MRIRNIILVFLFLFSIPTMAMECGDLCTDLNIESDEDFIQTQDPPLDDTNDDTNDDDGIQDQPDDGTDDNQNNDQTENQDEPIIPNEGSKEFFEEIRESYVYLKIYYINPEEINTAVFYNQIIEEFDTQFETINFSISENEYETCKQNIEIVQELTDDNIMEIFNEWETLRLLEINDLENSPLLDYFNQGNKLMECVFSKYSEGFSELIELDDRDENQLSEDIGNIAIRKMINLDIYSGYIQQRTSISYLDAGAYYQYNNNELIVTYVIPGSGAWNAGIRKNDIITHISGFEVDEELTTILNVFSNNPSLFTDYGNLLVNKSLEALNGNKTEENLESLNIIINSILKISATSGLLNFNALEVTIENNDIIVILQPHFEPTVFYMMLDNRHGYIYIEKFGSTTYNEVLNAIDNLVQKGAEGFVVDLRDNPGGSLSGTVNITSIFLEHDVVIIDYIFNDGIDRTEYNGNQNTDTSPFVVLVNDRSASASEVFSSVIQDYDRAEIIGKPTYGKGSINFLLDLNSGSSILFTVGRWYSPLNQSIERLEGGLGVQPDINIDFQDYLPPYYYVNPIPNENENQIITALDNAIEEAENRIIVIEPEPSRRSSRSSSGGSSSSSGGSSGGRNVPTSPEELEEKTVLENTNISNNSNTESESSTENESRSRTESRTSNKSSESNSNPIFKSVYMFTEIVSNTISIISNSIFSIFNIFNF